MKQVSRLVLGLLVAAAGGAALAQGQEPQSSLSFNVGVTTDYRFRGMAQTSTNPALQAGVDYAHKSGAYVGAWTSNVSWIKDYAGGTTGSLELDLYGGYKGELAKDVGFDVGLITYQYPGNDAPTNANTTEMYMALSYGPATLKYSRALGNFIANPSSSGSAYLDLSASFEVAKGVTLTPHIGRQTVANVANDAGDVTDLSLTLTHDYGNGLAVSLAASTTNGNRTFYTDSNGKFLGNNVVTLGVKYTF